MSTTPRLRIGQLLVDARLITQEALDGVLAMQKDDGRRLGALLVERGHISEVQLTQILSHQLSVPWVSLHKIEFSRQLLNLVPQELADQYCLLPIYVRRVRNHGETLYIAMDDPTNEDALRACAAYAGLPVRPMIAPPSDIRSAIRAYYGRATAETEPPPPAAEETPAPAAAPPAAHESDAAPATAPSAAHAAPEATIAEQPGAMAANAPPALAIPPPADAPAQETTGDPPADAISAAAPRAATHVTTLRSAMFEEADARESDVPPIVRDSRPTPIPAHGRRPVTDDPVIEVKPLEPRRSDAADRSTAIPTPRGRAPRMMSLTLLDGTTISLPAPRKKRTAEAPKTPAREEVAAPEDAHAPESTRDMHATLTARDLVDVLRAIAGGADPRTLLGEEVRWEMMFAALLSTLLKKQLIADWEFVEELSRVQKR